MEKELELSRTKVVETEVLLGGRKKMEREEVERVKHRQVVLGAELRFLCKLESLQSLTPN